MKTAVALFLFAVTLSAPAQVPQMINYQGRVAVGSTPFEGTGQFKFSLVNGTGTITYWSNDGTGLAGAEPTSAVSLPVAKGLYSLMLGDVALPGMTAIPIVVFNNPDVRVRAWFNDGVNGSQLLSPDQRIAAVGYAMMAGDVKDGAVTAAKLAPGAVASNLNATGQSGVAAGGIVLSVAENPALVAAGYARLGTASIGDSWLPRHASGGPSERTYFSTVWTGEEMIIWGGLENGNPVNTGARYNPATNTWSPVATAGAPAARYTHTALWTGTRMLVWGGQGGVLHATGGSYDPATNTWTPLNTTGAPGGRYLHTAVWTGSEMIIWGGTTGSAFPAAGGRYDPATKSWTPTSISGGPEGRREHIAVWSGTEMIIFGGYSGTMSRGDGWRYSPATGTWSSSLSWTPPSFPTGASPNYERHGATAVWTGSEAVIWAGSWYNTSITRILQNAIISTPANNNWVRVDATGGPAATPEGSTAPLIVWTGNDAIAASPSYGWRKYNPARNLWQPINAEYPPVAITAVWSGTEVIVWGKAPGDSAPNIFAYSPPRTMVLYQRP